MLKKRILLLAGGQSEEHEVSLSSAKSVLSVLSTNKFEVTSLVINKTGRWLTSSESQKAILSGTNETEGTFNLQQSTQTQNYDVVFPILHGPMGEDGTIQGLLTLAGIPFVGSGVLGSAVCMDKVMAKSVLASHDLPQVAYRLALRSEWANSPEKVKAKAYELGFPLFVKPANLGSSVGINKAQTESDLERALDLAFSLDRRVILEAMTPGGKPRELEVGILGNDHPIASPVGELSYESDFYDYYTKYTEGQANMSIPARVPKHIAELARQMAITAFKALDCAGLARVDFFYVEATGELLLNEVNTMPGFTTTSMYPKLWEATGLSYSELVERLIELALEK